MLRDLCSNWSLDSIKLYRNELWKEKRIIFISLYSCHEKLQKVNTYSKPLSWQGWSNMHSHSTHFWIAKIGLKSNVDNVCSVCTGYQLKRRWNWLNKDFSFVHWNLFNQIIYSTSIAINWPRKHCSCDSSSFPSTETCCLLVWGWEQSKKRKEEWGEKTSELGQRRKSELNQPDLTLFHPRVLPQPTKTCLPQLCHLIWRCSYIQKDAVSFTSEAIFHTSNILLEVKEFLKIHNKPVIPTTWKRVQCVSTWKLPSLKIFPIPSSSINAMKKHHEIRQQEVKQLRNASGDI